MKGIILCGGKGTRLYPLTQITNKNLLPVYDKPVITYAINTLVRSGINEVILVTGGADVGDFLRYLRDGTQFGIKKLEYTYHEPQKGVLDALYLARHFAAKEPLLVIMADNITDETFTKDIQNFKTGAKLFIKPVSDPTRYGVVCIENECITKIDEKPKNPCSTLAITGIFLYDNTAFDHIKTIIAKKPDADISYLNRSYLKKSTISFRKIKKFWTDIGTIPDLFQANYHYAKKSNRKHPLIEAPRAKSPRNLRPRP